MKNWIKKIIVGSLVIGGSLFCYTQRVNSQEALEDIVNGASGEVLKLKEEREAKKAEVKEEKKALGKTRLYNLGLNFLINEVIQGGVIDIKSNKEWLLPNGKRGWSDDLRIRYEYAALSSGYRILLKDEKDPKKEKKLFLLDYTLSYNGEPFINYYRVSDGKKSLDSYYYTGGFKRKILNNLSVGAGIGLKYGNDDPKKGKDVVSGLLSHIYNKNDLKTEVKLMTVLPRQNYIKGFEGMYIFDGTFNVSFGEIKKLGGIIPKIGVNVRNDVISVKDEQDLYHKKRLTRWGLTVGFDFKTGRKEIYN